MNDKSSLSGARVEAGGPLLTSAVNYAVAVLRTQADVSSADHRPVIEGYIRRLEALLPTAPVPSEEDK
jgi:hypothetical protein